MIQLMSSGTYARVGDQWLLDGITPSTASKWVVIDQIRDFAVKNGGFLFSGLGALVACRLMAII